MSPKPDPDVTVDNVKDFWESHVNNEYYTSAARASDAYFDEIESRRYNAHYNLVDLFDSLRGTGRSHGSPGTAGERKKLL